MRTGKTLLKYNVSIIIKASTIEITDNKWYDYVELWRPRNQSRLEKATKIFKISFSDSESESDSEEAAESPDEGPIHNNHAGHAEAGGHWAHDVNE